MRDAERTTLDHVVLPRRRPGLALLERLFPGPAENLLDAELAAFANEGDTVLDPWAGTGWTARRTIQRGLHAVAADASPLAQLAGVTLLTAPDPIALDAAFAQLAGSRRVDVPLRQHLEELYASRCRACRRPVVVDQFIWPRDGDAPGRKIYRCASCEAALGGGEADRVAPVDEIDLAKLGIDTVTDAPPPAASAFPPVGAAVDDPDAPLGEAGGPPIPPSPPVDPPLSDAPRPRFASTVRPDPVPVGSAEGIRHAPQYLDLVSRFPVLDGRHELVAELLDLYTPRNLYALHAIGSKIDSEVHDPGAAGALRLALASVLLPASRLNGYPGRVAGLRISAGHVRQPASRHQREINVWRAFEEAYREVRAVVAETAHDRRPARFAADAGELGGMDAANVLWLRSRPGVVSQYLPPEGIDVVLSAPAPPRTHDELSFEYLATSWILGREAAETLPLEAVFAGTSPPPGAEATAVRHGLASAFAALKPGGRCSLLLEGVEPDRLVTFTQAAVAAGFELTDLVHRESRRSGDGLVLHLRKPSAEDRLRAAAQPGPLRLGVADGHLTYPELASAIERAVVDLLRDRGEPAGLLRVVSAITLELARAGLLRRFTSTRAGGALDADAADDEPRALDAGPHALATLIREELWRDEHPALVRIGDEGEPQWWLRDPELAQAPLTDRVERAAWSVLSTAGRIDEDGFLDRIYALFPGLAAPDEELVRATLDAYAAPGERGSLGTDDDLASRTEDHARVIARLVEYGHRLGLRTWIARREQERTVAGRPLLDLLSDEERRVYLPLVVRGAADALGSVDVIWYVRGKLAFLFEVEWTATVGETILGRGREIPVGEQQARFLVLPARRAELLRLKLQRSPWLRAEVERQNWHVLKWEHLETLAARPGARLEWLEPVLGLDPLIERGGEQLTMFGE
ncbi:MAG TPA: hypothetical protein VFM03_03755 [Candidatus Limnocylindria bacterium]|nr:hypothetical protein [Candidatus Limnocylindria bacterium]